MFRSSLPSQARAAARFCALVVAAAAGLAFARADAQSSDGNGEAIFRGAWRTEAPEKGTRVILLKRGGRASWFWADTPDRTVYHGEWTSDEETARVRWDSGARHRLRRDAVGYGLTFFDASGNESHTGEARKVPEDILGQWAKPPEKPEEMKSDRDEARGFFGIWEVGEGDDAFHVFVEEDRSTASTRSPRGDNGRGLRGAWAKQGSELHIVWDSGHYSILRENERGFGYKRIPPGKVIEEDDTEPTSAIRTSPKNVPSGWLNDYREERETRTGGIAFSARKEALRFYRGNWVIRRGEQTFEKIDVGRFGGLGTTRDPSLGGEWRMEGQDLFMRWDDGMRKVLSPIGDGFVLYEYRPGRPIEGVPTRVFPAAPADREKLEAHLAQRKQVAERLLRTAEAAGLDPRADSGGWGRTFMRWAWPFGDESDEEPETAEGILREGYEGGDDDTDPWWWPFWSEKPEKETKAEDAPTSASPGDAEDGTTETSGSATPPEAEAPAPSPDAPAPDEDGAADAEPSGGTGDGDGGESDETPGDRAEPPEGDDTATTLDVPGEGEADPAAELADGTGEPAEAPANGSESGSENKDPEEKDWPWPFGL